LDLIGAGWLQCQALLSGVLKLQKILPGRQVVNDIIFTELRFLEI